MRPYLTLCLLVSNFCAYAQDSTLTYSLKATFAGFTNVAPFWSYVNSNGSFPIEKLYVSGQFGIYKVYNPNNPRLLQFSGGAEVVTNYGRQGDLFFTDLYMAAKIGKVEFLAGQKKRQTGLMDSTLTSGSLSFSGNSRPIPQFQVSTPDFIPLSFTNGAISLKASYSEGILGTSRILFGSTNNIPSTKFHQKQIYFRIGNSFSRLKIYLGMNHQAIWGGENKITPAYDRKLMNTYWHVITGKSLDYRKVGFHFGTYDVAGEWQGKDWVFFIYRQNIYENGSLFKVINFADGLNGFKISRRKPSSPGQFVIKSAVVEVIGTKDQRNLYSSPAIELYKTGNYYNDFIYARGWSYYDRTMGTPLIPSKNTTAVAPTENVLPYSNNNRILAFHGALTASWQKINFVLKATYSRNFGTYVNPFDSGKNQISMIILAEKNIPILSGVVVNAGLASDIGDLYPSSNGIVIGIKKYGFLNY